MSDVFISYSREDRLRAEALAQILQQQGWSVWWDRDILPGQTFDRVIEEALNVAKCVIVLWSHYSVASNWVKDEAEDAATRQILVPALIEDIAIPLGFRRLQTANLSDWHGSSSHAGIDQLLSAVSEKLGSQISRIERKPSGKPATYNPNVGITETNRRQLEWRAEPLYSGLYNKTIRIWLTYGQHVIEYHFGLKDYVKVDGMVVFSTIWGSSMSCSFSITDGDVQYSASIECDNNFLFNKRFRLIIAGHVIYSEGNW